MGRGRKGQRGRGSPAEGRREPQRGQRKGLQSGRSLLGFVL